MSSGAPSTLAYKANTLPAGQILQPSSVDFKESSFYWERLPLNWEGVEWGDENESLVEV